MNEFDITVVTFRALSDLLAQFPSRKYEPLHEARPDEEICSVETEEWSLTFDDSSIHREGGAGVVLYAIDGSNIFIAFKLEFFCSNNEVENKDLIIGLKWEFASPEYLE